MKKIIITPFFGISLLAFHVPQLNAQEQIAANIEFGRPCGIGRGLCSIEASTDSLNVAKDKQNNIFLDGLNRVNLKILKQSLSKEMEEREFKNHYLYFVEEEFQLLREKKLDKPMVITRGAHPIIEMEDSYIISFTIKNNP